LATEVAKSKNTFTWPLMRQYFVVKERYQSKDLNRVLIK
jgi:hypothetical protein